MSVVCYRNLFSYLVKLASGIFIILPTWDPFYLKQTVIPSHIDQVADQLHNQYTKIQDHQQENGQWVLVSFGPLLLMFGHLFFLRWTWMWSWVVGSGATPPLATTDPRWNPTSTCLGTTGRCSFCDKWIPGYDHIKQIQVFSHLENHRSCKFVIYVICRFFFVKAIAQKLDRCKEIMYLNLKWWWCLHEVLGPYANPMAVWHSANRTGLYNMQGVLQQKMTWKSRLVNCYVSHPGFTVTSLCIIPIRSIHALSLHKFATVRSVTLSQAHLPDINWGDLGGMPFRFTLQATKRAEGLGSGFLETWPKFMEFFVIGSLVFFQDTMEQGIVWKRAQMHRKQATRFSPHRKALPCQFLSPIVFGLSDSWGRQTTVPVMLPRLLGELFETLWILKITGSFKICQGSAWASATVSSTWSANTPAMARTSLRSMSLAKSLMTHGVHLLSITPYGLQPGPSFYLPKNTRLS